MKMRNKGKVHPSPSSSSSSSSSDFLSILKLLPAAILALASVLSLEDKEVLAYMITRSIKSTNPSSILEEKSKKKSLPIIVSHKPPMFDCECFDCYTSYWFKWDSSLNRELIHQAIEAFEDHLNNNNGEVSMKKGRNKKREQKGRRGSEKFEERCNGSPEIQEICKGSPENEVGLPEVAEVTIKSDKEEVYEVMEVEGEEGMERMVVVEPPETEVVVGCSPATSVGGSHKGLARKVLPDVLGLFNSRLWSLWSPNV